jgi:hypothetical protein
MLGDRESQVALSQMQILADRWKAGENHRCYAAKLSREVGVYEPLMIEVEFIEVFPERRVSFSGRAAEILDDVADFLSARIAADRAAAEERKRAACAADPLAMTPDVAPEYGRCGRPYHHPSCDCGGVAGDR